MRVRVLALSLLLPTALVLVPACSDGDPAPAPTKVDVSAQVPAVLQNYAANLETAYADVVVDQTAFNAKIDAFLAAPTEATLTTTRDGWSSSREHYMLVEGARFYGGPIDAEPANHEGALNAWPLDEAYIDYTTKADGSVDETVGFVNNAALLPDITAAALDEANGVGGDENVSNGWHAIEFLLWGQALSPVGPGARPATDYVVGGPRANADRRRQYLTVAAAGVLGRVTALRDAWAPTAPYRTTFVAGGLPSVGLALAGLGKMSKGELASQRINAAYASKARRDQHDCFSSLTLTDYERDAIGIQAMYLGNYGANDGPGFDTLVHAVSPDIDTRLQKQLQTSVDAIKAIPKPFEAAIVGNDDAPGRVAIRAAVASLRAQGDLFGEAAGALGLTIAIGDSTD